MIKHDTIMDKDAICKFYSNKDGVDVKYVCTTALDGGTVPVDVFYRATPHPHFGNRYLGLYMKPFVGAMITNADKVEGFVFDLIEDDDGDLVYSAHRHDYKQFSNGNVVGGGRCYTRSTPTTVLHKHVVRDGEMIKK